MALVLIRRCCIAVKKSLRGFDLEIRAKLREEMVKKGIDVRIHTNVDEIVPSGDEYLLKLIRW